MDKRYLTTEELRRLEEFILSRSPRFGETGVLLEIMDHFACKTEEILEAEPELTFELAMKKAHHAFGVKGFGPVAEAYERNVFLRYTRLRRDAQRSILWSLQGPGVLLAGLLVAQLFLWFRKTGFAYFTYTDGADLLLVIELAYVLAVLPLQWQLHRKLRRYPLLAGNAGKAFGRVFIWLLPGLILLPNLDRLGDTYFAILLGLLTSFLLLQFMVLRRIFAALKTEAGILEQQRPPAC